jgi:hypothetical protein
MLRRVGLPILAAAVLIACASFVVVSWDFDTASAELVQVHIPLSVTQQLRHAVSRRPRDPAAYWPVFPQLYVFVKSRVFSARVAMLLIRYVFITIFVNRQPIAPLF